MRDLDFTESFTEKVLADYPLKKVEEKLELYARGRQVRNPVGWLMAALKKDYREEIEINIEEESPSRSKVGFQLDENENKKISPREEALGWIKEIKKSLSANC
ncbi:MAG: hypothetical protein U9R12_07435, partial [Candidatus Caldatribacteriota bacterium]|nr:hypothetical protein [Candidatus Caldatribacteriota bacterium]